MMDRPLLLLSYERPMDWSIDQSQALGARKWLTDKLFQEPDDVPLVQETRQWKERAVSPKVWLSPNVDRILRLWQSHGCWIKMCVEDLIQHWGSTSLTMRRLIVVSEEVLLSHARPSFTILIEEASCCLLPPRQCQDRGEESYLMVDYQSNGCQRVNRKKGSHWLTIRSLDEERISD